MVASIVGTMGIVKYIALGISIFFPVMIVVSMVALRHNKAEE